MTCQTVCILTAGKGSRMGPFAPIINKALLPVADKALISHIIEQFPRDTSFIIALGYKGEQVRDYLNIAHSDLDIKFVNVDRYEGVGSGPGYSLLCCRKYLSSSFYFVSCDTLFHFDNDSMACLNRNWIAVASIPQDNQKYYCNVLTDESGRVVGLYDKQSISKTTFAFTGLMYIHDGQIFWQGFGKADYIAGELQVSAGLEALAEKEKLYTQRVSWTDLGDYEKYKNHCDINRPYDFGKTNEFLYFINDRVIKFFSDPKIASSRVKKAKIKPDVFPQIDRLKGQFYSYSFVQGETLYKANPIRLFKTLLSWLEKNVWTPYDASQKYMLELCQNFYKEKTLARLAAFNHKHPDLSLPSSVNGKPVLSIDEITQRLPWDELYQGIPSFIHGDLQFDNILYHDNKKEFILLDWRQDFSGELAFGDLYYDLAKLLGGMMLNYDYIKQALFTVDIQKDNIYIDFAQRYSRDACVEIFREYLNHRQLSYRRVCILTGLIYLNMAPLHTPPFDQMLHAFGRLWLTKLLMRKDGEIHKQKEQHQLYTNG